MRSYQSPKGDLIVATFEQTPCSCGISGINDDGTPEYDGTGSQMHWDDQKPITRDGKILFQCEDGKLWTFDQLTVREDAADDEDNQPEA